MVTDSTAYLPPDLVAAHGLTVVPLQVVVGSQAYAEGEGIDGARVAAALRAWEPVSTSRPSPTDFAKAYLAAAEAGADGVVSVHLSGEISGTVQSARLAAAQVGERDGFPVEVVDSRSLGMGLGYAALAAAQAAAAGADLGAVGEAARDRARRTVVYFSVDTLEHLRRGGRIGAAQALLGSALAIKPLLALVDGRIVPREKVRTTGRAVARLEELCAEAATAAGGPVHLAVHHLAEPQRAADLVARLRHRVPLAAEPVLSEVGAVVGAHVGPGMLGVVVAPS